MTELQKSSGAAIVAGMKAAVTLSSRGTLTLPAKLRQSLGLKADDQLIAETVPGGLLLRPAVTLPVEMYTDERLAEFDAAEAELAAAMARKKRRAPVQPLSTGLDDALSVLPPDDRLVLAAAIRLRFGAFVTGDKRDCAPLPGRRVRGVAIHSPASVYIAVIRGKGQGAGRG